MMGQTLALMNELKKNKMPSVRFIYVFCVFLLVVNNLQSQNTGKIRFMFYNVENLFDTFNDPSTSDDEFTPTGRLRWTNNRYSAKLLNIYKVIAGVGDVQPPEIIGLCEIENWKVLNDLITLTPLTKYRYNIIHRDSPDPRGIDVAILYRSDVLKELDSKAIPVTFPDKKNYKTRDILMTQFILPKVDTVYLFVNHWPSRRRGELETAVLRTNTARILKKEISKINASKSNAKIIIAGDLNDEPTDPSLITGLQANIKLDKITRDQLYNLSVFFPKKTIAGTYKFRGEWETFDQIIVSGSLLKTFNGIYTNKNNVNIFYKPFILEKDESYLGEKPYKTYNGIKYTGGYSDHLPVYIDLILAK
jgi:predicted extracellular nuclease